MRGRKIHFFCDGAAKPVVVGKSAAWKTAVFFSNGERQGISRCSKLFVSSQIISICFIMKYPIGIQDFKFLREGGFVYVDKTALVYDMVTRGKTYILSRPRRFGKSILVSTLEYYFKGERELFKGLVIDGMEKTGRNTRCFTLISTD